MRVALVAGPDPGHLFPVLAVGQGLRARGHEVLVATGKQWDGHLQPAGLPWLDLPLLAPTDHDTDLGFRVWGRAIEMGPPLAAALAGFTPELVVCDTLTQAGAVAALLHGVPWIEVCPHHLMDPDPTVPPVGLGRRPPRTPLGRLEQSHIRGRQRASVAAGRRVRAEQLASIGLDPDAAPLGRLVGTLPGLEHRRRRWPRDAYVVGPLEWEPPTWPVLDPPPGEHPLVVVTDTTASAVTHSLAEAALAGLADEPVRVVATTTRELDGPRPAACAVGRSRHGPLLSQAAVAVGPGGHGFITKALSRGVPVALTPLQGDQREAAARVRNLGAGVWIRGRAGPLVLRAAVRRLLGSPRARAAAHQQAVLARAGGAARAADVVENLVAASQPSSRARSPAANWSAVF